MYMYICTGICICTHICVNIYIYTYTCTYIHIYIYICIGIGGYLESYQGSPYDARHTPEFRGVGLSGELTVTTWYPGALVEPFIQGVHPK